MINIAAWVYGLFLNLIIVEKGKKTKIRSFLFVLISVLFSFILFSLVAILLLIGSNVKDAGYDILGFILIICSIILFAQATVFFCGIFAMGDLFAEIELMEEASHSEEQSVE